MLYFCCVLTFKLIYMKKKLFLAFAVFTATIGVNAQKNYAKNYANSHRVNKVYNEPNNVSVTPNSSKADVKVDITKKRGAVNVTDTMCITSAKWSLAKSQAQTYKIRLVQAADDKFVVLGAKQTYPFVGASTLKGLGLFAKGLNPSGTTSIDVAIIDGTGYLGTETVLVKNEADYKTKFFNFSKSYNLSDTFQLIISSTDLADSIRIITSGNVSGLGVNSFNGLYNEMILNPKTGYSVTSNTDYAIAANAAGTASADADWQIYPIVDYSFENKATIDNECLKTNLTAKFSFTGNEPLLRNPFVNVNSFFMKYAGQNKAQKRVIATILYDGNQADTLDNLTGEFSFTKTFADNKKSAIKVSEILRVWGYSASYTFVSSTDLKVGSEPVPVVSGNAAVCVGATINLTSSATGGTWTSSAATKATVTAGAVKGIAPGTATISYKVGTGDCSSTGTKLITVEAAPAVTISGPSKICWNGRAMMRSSVAGGVWGVENSALLLASPQGLFRNPTKPATDNFKSGVNYTVKSKLGACSSKVVKAVYVRTVTAPLITVTAPSTSVKVNATVTATAATTIAATGTWSSTNTLVSATANTANTKTAAVKGLRVGTGANVVYFADDATTGCRQANWAAFSVTAAASMVDANQGSISSTTEVSVYPNPSNGVVTFENIAGAKSISLVDMTGRTVKTVAVNADRMTVNFSGVQNGKYLVQVAGENVNEVRSIVIE